MNARLLIAAAGPGTRLERDLPKALIELEDVPLLVRTLGRFEKLGLVDSAVVAVAPSHRQAFEEVLTHAYPDASFTLVDGGDERQDSVGNMLDALGADTGLVLIHDAARPFIEEEAIRETMKAAEAVGASTLATPCVDTILEADEAGLLRSTPNRIALWACQTPQVFKLEIIRKAYAAARKSGATYTDDATLVHQAGHAVKIVAGSAANFKITTPHDLARACYRIREGKA